MMDQPATTTSTPQASPIGIILAEPQAVVRAGLALLIRSETDFEVLIEGGVGEEALSSVLLLQRRSHMVALVGLGIGSDHDPFRHIRALRERIPTLAILACAARPDDFLVSRALFMGADGFAGTGIHPTEFLDALRRTARGEVVLAGVPGDRLGRIADKLEESPTANEILTEREMQVLSVAVEGLTARQIGTRLGVRERTVTTHLSRIYRKLGAGSRMAAVVAARHAGLLSIGETG
jgi:two-component system, NarL family, response regulator DevR